MTFGQGQRQLKSKRMQDEEIYNTRSWNANRYACKCWTKFDSFYCIL